MNRGTQDSAPGKFDARILDRIFKATSVVVVGASPQRGNPRNSIVRVLLQTGFPGRIFLVHPRHAEVEGLQCHPDIPSLPEVPDVALVITPSETVAGVIEACGTKGIPAAVVFSSGFEEMDAGKALAAALLETANRWGVAILGANCQGAWSVRARTVLSFGAAAMQLRDIVHSPIAIISQSGALAGAIGFQLQMSAIGCAYMISVGNETQLDMLDCLSWIIEQEDVRTVALYVEGFRDGARLLTIAERARETGIQIVVLKAGNSSLGQSATASHTGKIASAHAIYRDVLEQAGVIVVESLADLLACIEVLTFLPDPRVSDDPHAGVAALSISGGACALLADHAEHCGVPMSEFSPQVAGALEAIFPPYARPANPADLTGYVRSQPTVLDDSLALVSGDSRTEAFIMQFASSGRRDLDEKGGLFTAVARDKQLPVIMSFAGEEPASTLRDEYRRNGVLFCADPMVSIRSLKWLYQRRRFAARAPAERRRPTAHRDAPGGWPEMMSLLAGCNIRTPGWHILQPRESAGEACRHLAYPVAVKALPGDALHKSELGLVRLHVATPQQADAEAAAIRNILERPGTGVLVQEMSAGGVETVLSCLRGTDFGPVMTIGLGGIGIELFRDVVHTALPVDRAWLLQALSKLRLWTLLEGFRGAPRADIEALVNAAARFGDQFLAMPEVGEFEINPLLVLPQGHGVLALDALVTSAAGGVR